MNPAGWYDDPGDAQQIRYWDGTTWTGQVAPRPAHPAAAAPTHEPAPSAPEPRVDPYGYRDAAHDPFSLAPSVLQNPRAFRAAETASTVAGIGSSIAGIIFAGVFIAGSLFIFSFFDFVTAIPAGSLEADGRVVSLTRSEEGGCSPVAQFFVDGTEYTASSVLAQSPCPWSVGAPVTVTYHPSSIESSARVKDGAGILITVSKFIFVGVGALVGVLSVRRLVRLLRGR
jgi:hypothetical protein